MPAIRFNATARTIDELNRTIDAMDRLGVLDDILPTTTAIFAWIEKPERILPYAEIAETLQFIRKGDSVLPEHFAEACDNLASLAKRDTPPKAEDIEKLWSDWEKRCMLRPDFV